jgi:hypothetical protein
VRIDIAIEAIAQWAATSVVTELMIAYAFRYRENFEIFLRGSYASCTH